MSDSEPSISELSSKIEELTSGIKWLFGVVLNLFSIPNVIAASTIPHFAQIFQDALPGKPLPTLTTALVSHPFFFQLLALAWPFVGVIIIIRAKRIRTWTIAIALIVLGIFVQLILTEIGIFMPMVSGTTGMSDAK